MKRGVALSLKARLVYCTASICLIIAMMIVGVFASETVSLNFSGNLRFDATDVVCQVSGSVTGANQNINFETLNYSSKTEPTDAQISSWSNDISFRRDLADIIITITVTNLAPRAMYVSMTDLLPDSANSNNIVKSLAKQQTGDDAASIYTSGSRLTLPAATAGSNNSVTFTLRVQVDNKNFDAFVSYSYLLGLYDESVT